MNNKLPTFEYETPTMGKVSVTLGFIKKHFEFLASSEDGHDAIEISFKKRNLMNSDFKIVLEYDEVVIRNFGTFFLVYDAGIVELYVDENGSRYIRNIGDKSLSFSLTPNGFGARFTVGFEQDENVNNLRMKEAWGMDVAIGKDETAFALIGAADRQLLIMGQWKDNHDDVACKALKEYDDEAEAAEWKYGRAFGFAKLMKEKALKYGTTIEEMKKHWRCTIQFRP